jgi:hypothetical protein
MNFALEARCSLAISRVLESIDPAESARRLTEARNLAVEEGFSGVDMSALIGSEPVLRDSFMVGLIGHQSQLFDDEKRHDGRPDSRWTGSWTQASSGEFETLPYVVSFGRQYMSKVDISHSDGALESVSSGLHPTLLPAIREASQLETEIHSEYQKTKHRPSCA